MDKCVSRILLSEKHIKITKQRVIVLDFILSRKSPFTVNDIYNDMKKKLDVVTIYRNLKLFSENKILREVMNCDEGQYYELSCEHNPAHPHFYCDSCKKIFCVKTKKNFPNVNKISVDGDFLVKGAVLYLTGLCPDCKG